MKKSPSVATGRNRRVLAPPPTQYVSPTSDPGETIDLASGGSASANESRGKMMYPYSAGGEGEITVADGQEVVIVEPDGKMPSPSSLSS
jgi:hypothetical protein